MTIVNSAELGLLRTHPHSTKLWLSIYQPQVALACRANTVVHTLSKGSVDIYYTDVTAGSYQLVEPDMVMLVGTTPGGSEKGRIRVRSINSSYISVAENSHINWENEWWHTDYLTVLRYFEIVAKYPRILEDDNGNTTWYKDYDIEYTNQNDILGSFICMGSHYAGFLENGQCKVYYSASGTTNLLGENLTYSWFFQGATTTGSSVHTPGYITYTTPGHYTTRLQVTSTSGAVDKSYRHVSIYNRPTQGTNVPILNWEITGIDGSRDTGGYTATIRVHESASISKVRDGSLVVIFADDYYGGTKYSIGGNAINRNNIVFVGYVLKDTIKYNYANSYVEFDVGSPTEVMKRVESFSVACNSSSNPSSEATTNEDIPSAWVLVKDMDIRRGLYYYLKWHSTTNLCADIEFRGQDKYVKYLTIDIKSLYDAANSWMYDTLLGEFVSDRQGKLWAEVSVMATDLASGTFPTAMSITKADWMNEPVIEEDIYKPLAIIELGGFAYSGATTGTSTPYLSQAPGRISAYEGGIEQIEGLVINSQDDLNALSGNVFAYKNARFPSVSIQLAGNYRNFDIAPIELVSLNISQDDTKRGIVFQEKPFEIRGVSLEYNAQQESLITSLDLHEVTQGFPGDTIVIPPEAPDDWGDNGGDDWTIEPPPPPGGDGGVVPPPVDTGDPAVAYMIGTAVISGTTDLIFARSTDFNTSYPHWEKMISFAFDGAPEPLKNMGAICDYVPMGNNPAQGGYLIMASGTFWITGLNTDNPMAITILTSTDAANLITPLGGIGGARFGRGTCRADGILYVLASDDTGFMPHGFVLKRMPDNTWSAVALGQIGNINYNGPAATIINGYTTNNHIWIATNNSGIKIYRSTDGSQTWNYIANITGGYGVPANIYLPQNISWGDIPIFCVGNNNTSTTWAFVRANNTFSQMDYITIQYNGEYFAGYETAFASTPYYRHMITAQASNPNNMVAMLGGYNHKLDAYIFTSNNGGTSWTYKTVIPRYSATGQGDQAANYVTIHPYNSNYLYVTTNHGFSAGHIVCSHDGGSTWISKDGDWQTKFSIYPTFTAGLRGWSSGAITGMLMPQF